MPGRDDKQHRIRVRTLDGKQRDTAELNRLKSNLLGMPHLDIVRTVVATEFIILASKKAHIDQASQKLQHAGLEVIEGGDTADELAPSGPSAEPRKSGGRHEQGGAPTAGRTQQWRQTQPQGQQGTVNVDRRPLPGKPYGFVALPAELTGAKPVWHDGTSARDGLSGEVRFELETLTPLLVGWERGQVGDVSVEWPVPDRLAGTELAQKKSVLCPLRAPWGKRPVVIPGDSLKGLLRHELGALLGAPMERVAERSYSYRPNAMYPPEAPNRFLVPRLARVLEGHIELKPIVDEGQARVPTRLELFPDNLRYNKRTNEFDYRFDQAGGSRYRGGQGAGQKLNSKRDVHYSLKVLRVSTTELADVPPAVRAGYLATVRHLVDTVHGHFSERRHPDVPKEMTSEEARARILTAARDEVFQPGDYIWVEWDTEKKCIVSLGWHYYYRWAYTDSVRRDADAPKLERRGLFPLENERRVDASGAPMELSAVRRLLGYTSDNEVRIGIGEGDHTQLMGRLFVNSGLEVVAEDDSDEQRFLRQTFLKELGLPRPSAVEFYLKQPFHPNPRPTDRAQLVTYGDAAGYDAPGELAGRKFYLDRKDAYRQDGQPLAPGPASDDSTDNRRNDRSTLAMDASMPGRRFRFTVRFRDLEAAELAALVVALCPDQFRSLLGATAADRYCSKLGYARPLGWGSVNITAKELLLLDEAADAPSLKSQVDLATWVATNHRKTSTQVEWLAIHRRKHPDAAGYPTARDHRGNENIHTFHTLLRSEHSRKRRYK